jgi:hypothetical protein
MRTVRCPDWHAVRHDADLTVVHMGMAPTVSAERSPRAALAMCAVLLLLVCGDMHFTARFFHMPTESFWGAISGLGILQLPVCWWLLRGFAEERSALAP